MYSVYRLDNRTLEESYFGVTNNPQHRIDEHCAGHTVALGHWDCGSHRITGIILHNGLAKLQASAIAHQYERTGQTAPAGYEVIQTGGV